MWYFLPYQLVLQEDGSYVVVNRRYKPVGLTTHEHVDYAAHPVRMRFRPALTPEQVRALDCRGMDDGAEILLYDPGNAPETSEAAWQAYSQRLYLLASLVVESPESE